MNRFDRRGMAGIALLAITMGVVAGLSGTRAGSPRAALAVVTVGTAYVALGLTLVWHLCTRVPLEGYLSGKHGWLIAAREWLARVLLFPLSLLGRGYKAYFLRWVVTRDHPNREPDEPILDAVWGGSWRCLMGIV